MLVGSLGKAYRRAVDESCGVREILQTWAKPTNDRNDVTLG